MNQRLKKTLITLLAMGIGLTVTTSIKVLYLDPKAREESHLRFLDAIYQSVEESKETLPFEISGGVKLTDIQFNGRTLSYVVELPYEQVPKESLIDFKVNSRKVTCERKDAASLFEHGIIISTKVLNNQQKKIFEYEVKKNDCILYR